MALAVRKAALLKPEIRLAQAVSEFEANLDAEHKAAFRNARIAARTTPPTPSDVMRLTAEIEFQVRQEHGPTRCFGPRLTNILEAVQQFAALGDTVVGGSQNLVACGVWSAIRMMLHVSSLQRQEIALRLMQMSLGSSSYLEQLSMFFMNAGRQAPRYQAMAIIYPQSRTLQRSLSEYFTTIVHLCQTAHSYTRRPALGQFVQSLNQTDLKQLQADLEIWAISIRDEAKLLLDQRLQGEVQGNITSRTLNRRWSVSSAWRQALERKMRWLEACSTYDSQAIWKQIRKQGTTSFLPTWAKYQQWKQTLDTSSAILFSGKVGAGKSVIMANIVDDLFLSGDTIVVYFFCRHDIPETLLSRTIMGSLALQYLKYFPETSAIFEEDIHVLGLAQLAALMKPKHDDRSRYLLIDGLDECSAEEQRSVLSQISWLQKQSTWRLGLSARFSANRFIDQHITLNWHISIPTRNPDIARYVDRELDARLANGQLKLEDFSLVHDIRAALLDGANGMFLWVVLQLDQICSEVSDYFIRLAIKLLPRNLSKTYARILRNSAAADTGQSHLRLFKFLVAAYEPLTISQVQEMVSVTIGDTIWEPSRCVNDILKIVGFCGGLVIVEEEDHTVRFVHQSARSFCQGVLGGSDRWEYCFSDDEAHREMGETAVTYLSYGIFDSQLSTSAIGDMDVGGGPERTIHNTLGTSTPVARSTPDLLRFGRNNNQDIEQVPAHAYRETTGRGSQVVDHVFLSYARKFWLLHTRSIDDSAVHSLWERLFDGIDAHDLQLTSHVVGLDNSEIRYKHPLALAFLWAVNHSHVAMFDRLMEMDRNYPFSTDLPWARFCFFRSLLHHLCPQSSLAKGPRLDPRMIHRLLSLAIVLRVFRAVEWMLPCVDSKETIKAFETAVSCGNYVSAAFISVELLSKQPDKIDISTKLFAIAVSSRDVRAISLLVNAGAAKSTETNTLALWSLLYSGMHQAPLLRAVFILINAGIQTSPLSQRDVSATLHLLAMSPEINPVIASEAVTKILATDSAFPSLHQHTLYQACSVGSFELAEATFLSYFNHECLKLSARNTTGYPFQGDELALVLKTVSKSRVRLASWLVERGCFSINRRIFQRAIILRQWQLADSLLLGDSYTRDALIYCTDHEILHICVSGGDLIGVDFLLKLGMDLNTPSTGPMFRHKTSMQALVAQDSDYFTHSSIAELYTRGVFAPAHDSPGFTVRKGPWSVLNHPVPPQIGTFRFHR